MGSGKAQPLNAKVLTDCGFELMKNIKVGTKVYGEDGNLHMVIGIYPQGLKPIYRITFSDGSSTECSDEHLWTYQKPQDKSKNIYRTSTLKEIMNEPLYKITNRNDKNWQFFIPITNPIKFNKQNLSINPYVLGVLLGDGHLSNSTGRDSVVLTNCEKDIIEKISKILSNDYSLNLTSDKSESYIIVDKNSDMYNNIKGSHKNKFKENLDNLNLLGHTAKDKFIPKNYLFSSIEDRIELLQGLIDTDGEVHSDYSYSTVSNQLALDVQFLVQSLGGTAKINKRYTYYIYKNEKKRGLKSYRITIKLPNTILPFSSKKHFNTYKKSHVFPKRTIQSIKFIGNKECQCILVNNPTHLYLTNDFIVTHNTESAINQMNLDTTNKYIYITPYLDEVERIKTRCEKRNFISPQNKGKGKLDSLHYNLGHGENIASTHALFKSYNDYTLELIKNGNYKLILDEVFDVIEKINIHKKDLDMLINTKTMQINKETRQVVWLDNEYDGDFNILMNMVKTNNVILYKDNLLLWTFPIEVFKAFKEVIILTYLFDAQVQKYYYDMNHVDIVYIGTHKENNKFMFTNKPEIPEYTKSLINKVHILYDEKLNLIGDYDYSLSVSWFEREKKIRQKPLIKKLKNNIQNVFTNKFKSASQYNMWTTYKDYKGLLSGKGYTSGFLSYNTRSTNEYRIKTHLAYCANIYFNPYLKNYFLDHGVEVKEDKFALSELIQWIWRSAIRDGKEIWIYIPSKRMRTLLQEWLNSLSKGNII